MHRAATYDDLVQLPEHLTAEIIAGELFAWRGPAPLRSRAIGGVLSQLSKDFDRAGGDWWFLYRVEVHLGEDVLVPDISGWRRQRMPAIADVPYIELAPDWVCEVLWPTTAAHNRYRKMPCYVQHGVEYAWIVDPVAKGIEIYQRQGQGWYQVAMHQGTTRIRAVPFEDAEINLARLWVD